MKKFVLLTIFFCLVSFPVICFSNDLYIEIVVEEKMLYLFEKDESGNKNLLERYQVCTFKPGLPEYPLGLGYVTAVEFDPYWYPTPFTVEYMNKKAGKDILRKGESIPPKDPRNAMGKFKIYLSHSTPTKGAIYRIHGTNIPSSIGTRQSGGCIRMDDGRPEVINFAKMVDSKIKAKKVVEVYITMKKLAT